MKRILYTQQEAEDFVTYWQGASSVDEVVKRAGMSASRAKARAGFLRKKGVVLKRFYGGGERLDYKRLKAIAAKVVRVQTFHDGGNKPESAS